jgi:CubicO group peptidase (beta-lactamase class C family)
LSAGDGEPLRDVAGWAVPAAVAVTDAERTLATVGPIERRWPWASVTKLLTALTVLVAAEEGTVGLDEPAGPPGATVRHLLAHASGLSPEGDRILAPPGRRRIYSNAAFDVLGAVVAAAAAMPFAEYLHAATIEPLGLTATTFAGSPASGAEGPVLDLGRLGRELLRPTLVSEPMMAAATRVAFPGIDGVLPGYGAQRPNDWGLGFEIRGRKAPHWTGARCSPATFGHFGRSGSFLWVDPVAGVACAELAGEPWGPWALDAWPPLADAVVDAYTLRR